MAYPSKFKQIEQERGKPIAEVLVEELNTHDGNISDVARLFKMTYANVYDKVQECGLVKTPVRWSLPEPEAEHVE